jgi:hypothetical protein
MLRSRGALASSIRGTLARNPLLGTAMSDPASLSASPRTSEGLPRGKPRWAFWKGLGTGALIEIPLISLAVWALARLGVGDPGAPIMSVVRQTAMFAGPAALLTAGGIGRLAADASATGSRPRAVYRAARAHAVASAALVMIAAIPRGQLPAEAAGWLAFVAAGAVAGAIAGVLIGAVCTAHAALVPLADVWSLARRPRAVLRTWLDPEDLLRLGAALRARTTNLFDGIFEPAAPPPPADAPAPPARRSPAEGAAPPPEAGGSAPPRPR